MALCRRRGGRRRKSGRFPSTIAVTGPDPGRHRIGWHKRSGPLWGRFKQCGWAFLSVASSPIIAQLLPGQHFEARRWPQQCMSAAMCAHVTYATMMVRLLRLPRSSSSAFATAPDVLSLCRRGGRGSWKHLPQHLHHPRFFSSLPVCVGVHRVWLRLSATSASDLRCVGLLGPDGPEAAAAALLLRLWPWARPLDRPPDSPLRCRRYRTHRHLRRPRPPSLVALRWLSRRWAAGDGMGLLLLCVRRKSVWCRTCAARPRGVRNEPPRR